MDATLSSDPHAPDIDDSFRAARYRRAGADEATVAMLAAAHARLGPDERHAEAAWVDSHSDGDLRERIAASADVAAANAVLEAQALEGEWVPGDPFMVGTSTFPLWHLANGWVGTLLGDARNGFHLVAADLDALVREITHQVSPPVGTAADLAAWQQAKHLADLRARAAS
ncbi:MAG: hypothetical protein KGH75_00085 [Rhodospirillales bacterium]|nr:hypothetical protein [Rhodospirillales bacterium]